MNLEQIDTSTTAQPNYINRRFVDAVKQLCRDFSCLQNRPYMGDVFAALDGLLEHEGFVVVDSDGGAQ